MEPYAQIRADIRALVRNLGVLQTRYPELGLGVTQCHALLELEARELSLGELGAILQIETSTASRNLDTLERHGLIARRPARDDARVKLHRLSARGRAKLDAVNRRGDRVVAEAFAHLTPGERDTVAAGLSLFSRALVRAQARDVAIRPSTSADNPAIARVIRSVLEELGQDKPGTAYHEPTTRRIHDVYARAGGLYLVVERGDRLVGGAGILPHTRTACELKNMYFLAEARGGGHANRVVNQLLDFARGRGFGEVFLETYSGWTAARALYESFGFTRAAPPPFYRGHALCDLHYRLAIAPETSPPPRR